MLNNASLEQLIKIANELDSRGFLKESDEVDALIKEAAPCGGVCITMVALAVAGLIGASASKISEAASDIFIEMGVTDLAATPAPDLWEGFRNSLTQTDLIDGPGSFPAGHEQGGTFVRKVFDKRMEKMIEGDFSGVKIDEDEFQENVRKYWNVSSLRWHATNLDNENGWVDAWNAITDIFEEQYHAAKEVEKKKEDGMSEEDAIAAVAGGGAAGAAAGEAAAGAPPSVPGGGAFYYHGPSGQAQLSAEEIAGKVSDNRSARHLVWAAGWPAWKKWTEVPEVSDLVSGGAAAAPPPPPPPSAPARSHQGPAPDFSAPGAAAAEPEKPEYGSMEEAFSGRGDVDTDEALTSHNLRYDKDKDEWVEA